MTTDTLPQCTEHEECEVNCRAKTRFLKQQWFGKWVVGDANDPEHCLYYEPPLEELFL